MDKIRIIFIIFKFQTFISPLGIEGAFQETSKPLFMVTTTMSLGAPPGPLILISDRLSSDPKLLIASHITVPERVELPAINLELTRSAASSGVTSYIRQLSTPSSISNTITALS